MNTKYYNKVVTIGSQDGVGGRDVTFTAQDPYLIIRIENFADKQYKVSAIVKDSKEVIFELDLSGVKLGLPTGKDAVAIASQEKDFGQYGKTVDLIDTNVSIDWTGTTGKVTGNVKSYTYNNDIFPEAEKTGHFLPLVLDNLKGQKITMVTNKQKTVQDHEWIIRIDDVMTKTKKIVVKVGSEVLATLDLTSLTLQ